MAAVNPQTFFRFAAEHHALLSELYYKREGLSEAELLALVRRYADVQSPSAVYMRDRLVELGVLEQAPQATAQFEMSRPVASLMGYLLREYRMTSVEVIQAYFNAIDTLASDLAQAVDSDNSELLVRINGELEDHVERMRHDSHNNREAVTATVVKVKTNRERMPPRLRYETINRLWMRYIVPLRDIIDTHKSMDAALDRLARIYADAQQQFPADGTVQQVVRVGDARLRRLRQAVLEDFHESLREVTPLYEELRQETAMARGASQALERIAQEGLVRLRLAQRLGICNWQQRGLFSDSALEAYLCELQGYDPAVPEPIAFISEPEPPAHVSPDVFDERVRQALPIEDALTWLRNAFPELSLLAMLRLYGRLHSGRYGRTTFGERERAYELGGVVLCAHAMSVHAEPMVEAA